MSRIVSDLRMFFALFTMRGIIRQDFRPHTAGFACPGTRACRRSGIRHCSNDCSRLWIVLAHGQAGLCDLLLACRLGLRPGDLRSLTLDNPDWDAAVLRITQSKTGRPLRLPLTEEVGEALIDYLRNGRPPSTDREVFLRLRRPFRPFRDNSHISYLLHFWKERAGIRFRTKQRHGLHSLRQRWQRNCCTRRLLSCHRRHPRAPYPPPR